MDKKNFNMEGLNEMPENQQELDSSSSDH